MQDQEKRADLSLKKDPCHFFRIWYFGVKVRLSLLILILVVLLQIMLYGIDVPFRSSFNILVIVELM